MKEGRNWVLRRFQQLRSYRDEIETCNREEIPYSSRIVPRGLSVAEEPKTVLKNTVHLYSDQANRLGDPAEIYLMMAYIITVELLIRVVAYVHI